MIAEKRLQLAQLAHGFPEIAALEEPDSRQSGGASLQTSASIREIHSAQRQHAKLTCVGILPLGRRLAERVEANSLHIGLCLLEDGCEHGKICTLRLGLAHLG